MLRTIKYQIEYFFVWLLESLFFLLPRALALSCGERIGLLVAFFLPKREKLILQNLTYAFPSKSKSEIKALARSTWKNLGRTAVEFIRISDIDSAHFHNFFLFEGENYMEEAQKQGKGIIMATFHFTNWEMTGIALQYRWKNIVAIARPLKNSYVEKWVQQKRSQNGMEIILHRQAVRASLKSLKAGKSIGILMDQNLYQGGVFIDFMGRPAATTTLPALLHIRTGAPVILIYSVREREKFRIVYERPIQFPPIEPAEERLRMYTQIITNHIEAVIRRHPENWFWIHNRWKRSPYLESSLKTPEMGQHE